MPFVPENPFVYSVISLFMDLLPQQSWKLMTHCSVIHRIDAGVKLAGDIGKLFVFFAVSAGPTARTAAAGRK